MPERGCAPRRQGALTAKHGDIVVAVVAGNYTIKRLYKLMGRIELCPENAAYPPCVCPEGSELVVWGAVVGVVCRYCLHGYLAQPEMAEPRYAKRQSTGSA